MKRVLALLPLIALAGCNTTGQLSPQAQATITNAFNAVCPAVPSLAGLKMNSNQLTAYNAAVQICNNGAPTNVIVVGLDIVAVQAALAPLLSRVKVSG